MLDVLALPSIFRLLSMYRDYSIVINEPPSWRPPSETSSLKYKKKQEMDTGHHQVHATVFSIFGEPVNSFAGLLHAPLISVSFSFASLFVYPIISNMSLSVTAVAMYLLSFNILSRFLELRSMLTLNPSDLCTLVFSLDYVSEALKFVCRV